MSIDRRLLDILVCPSSRRPLRPLSRDQLSVLNAAIAAGGVLRVDGSAETTVLTEGLISDDRKVIYRIDDDIPVLLVESGTALRYTSHKLCDLDQSLARRDVLRHVLSLTLQSNLARARATGAFHRVDQFR